MAGMTLKTWIVAGMACATLAACQTGTGNGPVSTDAPAGDAAPAATSAKLVDRDVEAPEIFQTTDKALWDGRPSLGGVWVAAANAKNPERVIMRNPANGKFVIGGLYQREAAMPGPKLQLSSDAADALGLLAGEPAVISVTALRREEAAPPKPDATKPLLDSNVDTAAVPAGGKPASGKAGNPDIAANAAAAIDAATVDIAPTKPGAKPGAKPAAPAKPATAAAPAKPGTKPAAQAAATAQPANPAPAATATTTAAPSAEPTAQAATGGLILIGTFSVEANAKSASDKLAKSGITTTITKQSVNGKDAWSVTARGDAALLAKIKGTGFKDAIVLKR